MEEANTADLSICASVEPCGGPLSMGTCSWTDVTLLACGNFYPPGTRKSPEDLLSYYASQFPTVEVDMTTYSIPPIHRCAQWAKATPRNFTIHVKAFAMFTQRSIELNALPYGIRSELCVRNPKFETVISEDGIEKRESHRVTIQDLGDLLPELWKQFNESLVPIYEAGKLGVVLFQFMDGFRCNSYNIDYVSECRRYLDPRFRMAVEFRSSTWLSDSSIPQFIVNKFMQSANKSKAEESRLVACQQLIDGNHESKIAKPQIVPQGFVKASSVLSTQFSAYKDATLSWLRSLKLTLVAVDEIRAHDAGDVYKPPVHFHCTTSDVTYIRIHRRVGSDRLLKDEEIDAWARSIKAYLKVNNQTKRMYLLWNTNYEDQR
eukprot:TRINITY_DN574_c0_g1_i5.p1 TRINITY_DN574_c0_g1~~TRINITY_DN574_c0_g1_i5.p1  ORF type:complete len:376 (+),score=51.11 TRINITY_DN574_c0_g1_i5:82-1209(+)